MARMKTPTGTYTNREGQRWALRDLMPDPTVPHFWFGYRVSDSQLLHVHEHRLTFDENPPLANASPQSAPPETALCPVAPVQNPTGKEGELRP